MSMKRQDGSLEEMLPGGRLFSEAPSPVGRALKFCISLGLADVDGGTRRPAPDAPGSLATPGFTVQLLCSEDHEARM
jgi:hypothetical protein